MNRENLANRVSDIFNPLYTSTVFLFFVSLYAAHSVAEFFKFWILTSFFFSFLPLMDVSRRLKEGRIGDAHISNRKDRIVPFIISLFSAVGGLTIVYVLDMPAIIKAVSWSIVATGTVITAITVAWKISLHAAGISAIATVLVILYGLWALPLALFLPLVIWARFTLKKHTITQLIAGSFVSIAVTLSVFNVFALIQPF